MLTAVDLHLPTTHLLATPGVADAPLDAPAEALVDGPPEAPAELDAPGVAVPFDVQAVSPSAAPATTTASLLFGIGTPPCMNMSPVIPRRRNRRTANFARPH
jgi:hypothetical protein